METISIDKTGKIYLPKAVRDKIREKKYAVVVLPDGTIMLHKVSRIKDTKKALEEFQKLPKVKKPLRQIKREIAEEAVRGMR